ncbi:hypothetical protein LTR84_005270 [Exophiala bonariae]|uniref:GH16 domain-containing protein n=1 Tax=Exophiala bonariae TaxID=1690606 RepID=A0AAV9NQ99_9EURO|nr:hypothetical protein LTR84_005270 [Exophiala bonariae]
MAFYLLFASLLAVLVTISHLVTADPCNPLLGSCMPIPGLPSNSYSIDFTQQTETTGDWILADHATVTYGAPNGANFTFGKRKDAPYKWTRFYVLFGRIEVVLKAAPGAGIITGAVMMSDDLDEIDWEWSGNNFAQNKGQVQTNFFGKGIAGNYGRGTAPPVDSPQDQFHSYALDWTPESLTWSIDGKNVRTLNNNHETSGEWQYPQTPSRLHLGLWCSGDPETNSGGTVGWGGGLTDFSKLPYSAFVKSVKITTPNPCSSWKYPNRFDGIYKSVQCTNETISLPCTYTVVAGDDGYKIAKNLTLNFDTLKVGNPGVDWDKLLLGQVLKVPGGVCSTSSTTSFTSSTSMSLPNSLITSSSATFSSSSSSNPYMGSSSTTSASLSSTNSYTSSSPASSQSSLATSPTFMRTSSNSTPSISSTHTSSSSLSKTTTFSSTSSSFSMTPSSQSTTSSSKAPTTTSSASTSTSAGASMNATATSSAQASTSSQYKVTAGDYGYAIAQKLGCSFDALKMANPGLDWDKLNIGQTLNVPSTSRSTSTSVVSSTKSGSSSTSRSPTSTIGSTSGSSSLSSSGSGSSSRSSSSSQGFASSSDQASTTTRGAGTGSTTTSSTASPSSSPSSAPSTTSGTFAYGSSTTSQANIVQPTVAPNATTTTLKCNEDNCMRNVLDNRYLGSSSGYAFCTNYLNTTSTTPLVIPTYYSGCQGNASRVSSACRCLITNYVNASGIVTKIATSGAASSRKRSILRWERPRW